MTRTPGSPRATLARQVRAAGALLAILVFVAGAAYGVYWLAVGRPVLAGENEHDFGTIELGEDAVTLAHSFALTNRSGRRVEIGGVTTSCGCTAAEPSVNVLESGGTVAIDASLKLTRQGKKEAVIFLRYMNGDVDRLELRAEARMRRRLWTVVGPVPLDGVGSFERVIFFVDYDSNAEPPQPRASAPAGIRVEFGPWEQVTRRRRYAGLPARWKTTVRIAREGESWPPQEVVHLRVGDDQETTIPLGRPDVR